MLLAGADIHPSTMLRANGMIAHFHSKDGSGRSSARPEVDRYNDCYGRRQERPSMAMRASASGGPQLPAS